MILKLSKIWKKTSSGREGSRELETTAGGHSCPPQGGLENPPPGNRSRGAGDGQGAEGDCGESWRMSDWQKTTFGKVSTGFLSGGTPTTSRADYWKGEIPWITSKWLGEKLELTTGEKFVSEEAVKKTATKIVPKNSIIFATRVGVGKVGINRIDLAINQDLAGVLIDNERHDIKFLAYQLRLDSIQQYVAMNKRGATIKGITRDCLEQIRLNLPHFPSRRRSRTSFRRCSGRSKRRSGSFRPPPS